MLFRSLIEEVVAADPLVLRDPAAAIGVSTLADASIGIAVQPWVKVADHSSAGGEINRAIVEKFRAAGIVYPAPLRVVAEPAGNP